MEKKLALKLTSAALLAGTLASCNEQLEIVAGTSMDAIAEQAKQEVIDVYNTNFLTRFGEPAEDQTWGLDEQLDPIASLGGGSTRAGAEVGLVHVNLNEWAMREGTQANYGDRPYRESALAHDIQIPGWPHLNDLYYGNNGGSALGGAKLQSELTDGFRPCGDITEYEIQYVSAWFRTHKNPVSNCTLHLSDFFIQNVSADADQLSYGALDNSHGEQTGNNGENISQQDAANIERRNGSREAINWKLDNLGFMTIDGNWTHVNNFNSENTNFNPEGSSANMYREIKYITSSGTENFDCHPSFNSYAASDRLTKWVLMRLTWTETVKDPKSPKFGQAIPREGYYLAFDFQAEKAETKVTGDGYYSNWIVKITPGHFSPEGNARRIMCEDLGGTFDFDFNDAVIDVAFDAYDEAIISVQAAGGTMPIYVEKTADEHDGHYELHNLLGGSTTQPINVDYNRTHAPAIYRGGIYHSRKVSDISISVFNTVVNDTYTITGGTDERVNLNPNTDASNPYSNPTAKKGTIAPRAFAVPTDVKWMKECKWIDKTYTYFPNYVANKDFVDQTTGQPWYKVVASGETTPATSNLFFPTVQIINGSPVANGIVVPTEWTPLTPANTYLTHVGAQASLQLYGYNKTDAIWQVLTKDEATQATFTVVLKSKTKYSGDQLQLTMIPADVVNSDSENANAEHPTATMYYQGTYFNKSILSRWKSVSWQEDFGTNGKDADGNYTYIVSFTYTKDQLFNEPVGVAGRRCCDNIFFFIKDNPSGITIPEIYVHY